MTDPNRELRQLEERLEQQQLQLDEQRVRLLEQEGLLHEQQNRINGLEQRSTWRRAGSKGAGITATSERNYAPLPAPAAPPAATSRRQILRTGVTAAGVGVVAATAFSRPAAAATGGNMIIGQANTASTDTYLDTTSTTALTLNAAGTSGTTLEVIAPASGSDPWAIRASSQLAGYAIVASGEGSAVAIRAYSDRAPLELIPNGPAPSLRATSNRRGFMVVDDDANIWICIADGTPGTWRKIAGPSTAGAVHAITPARVYDSRLSGGLLAAGADRIVSVADGLNITTGAVTLPDVVPAGATSVTFTLTITGTVGVGFLAATPGDAGAFAASTINWFAARQALATGTLAKLDTNRQLRIWAGGGSTHFIIDITSYTL